MSLKNGKSNVMKRQIALFLIVVMMVLFVSCNHSSDTGSDTIMATSFITETKVDMIYYPNSAPFSETSTRLLYVQSGILHYYNKITEESHIFCFDPICTHSGPEECIAHKFMMADSGIQSIEYCEYDNRFYALRGAQLCSFSFDGSDLKIEQSFGEEGEFGANRHGIYLYGDMADLTIQGQYIYFFVRDDESGNYALTRFDVETKEIKRIFHDTNANCCGYLINDDTLYISMVGEYSGLYRVALDGVGLEKISDNIYDDFSNGIFDGERIYMIESPGGAYNKIVSFTPETDNFEDVLLLEDEIEALLAVSDEYVFYTKREPISVGFYESQFGKDEVFNYASKIYRWDKKSGDTMIVLDDIHCSTRMIYFIGDMVFIIGSMYSPDETKAFSNGATFIAKLDEKGTFIDLTLLED